MLAVHRVRFWLLVSRVALALGLEGVSLAALVRGKTILARHITKTTYRDLFGGDLP